uniref:Uncharacterized protein n=1 Tax=Anopheles funestus TaxID=62324 RepID=A0A182S369_ANOFN
MGGKWENKNPIKKLPPSSPPPVRVCGNTGKRGLTYTHARIGAVFHHFTRRPRVGLVVGL